MNLMCREVVKNDFTEHCRFEERHIYKHDGRARLFQQYILNILKLGPRGALLGISFTVTFQLYHHVVR